VRRWTPPAGSRLRYIASCPRRDAGVSVPDGAEAWTITCRIAARRRRCRPHLPDRGQAATPRRLSSPPSPRARVATPGPVAPGHNVRESDTGERRDAGAAMAITSRIAARRLRAHVATPGPTGTNDADFARGRHTVQTGRRGRERGPGQRAATASPCRIAASPCRIAAKQGRHGWWRWWRSGVAPGPRRDAGAVRCVSGDGRHLPDRGQATLTARAIGGLWPTGCLRRDAVAGLSCGRLRSSPAGSRPRVHVAHVVTPAGSRPVAHITTPGRLATTPVNAARANGGSRGRDGHDLPDCDQAAASRRRGRWPQRL
jgi:hypothetical protein